METFIKNRVSELLKKEESMGFKFIPNRDFYTKIGIRQKRWGQIIRNEKPTTTEELFKVSQYFKFSYADLLELKD